MDVGKVIKEGLSSVTRAKLGDRGTFFNKLTVI